MATVYVGSASIDERGEARGGAAGNQSGKELRTQAWYKHSKGWVVIRAKDAGVRARIAEAMRSAIANKLIGYDQSQRDTLYNAAKPHGFNPALVTVKCETDCSALVRVCCNYAGVPLGNIRTVNMPATMKATGAFEVLTESTYTEYPDWLMEGDVLCTPVSGHTVVVLNDGELAEKPVEPPTPPAVPTGVIYTVVRGDTLSAIGKRYSVPWRNIATANGIASPYMIFTGQKLTIPGIEPEPEPIKHTVAKGENLSRIAKLYGKKWLDIARDNGVKGPLYIIHPGQVLIIK
jgi:LysM repeat protein